MVVIATAQSNHKSADKFVDERWPAEFAGIDTTFQVQQILKGKLAGKKFKVLHFHFGKFLKQANGEVADELIDSPGEVSFRTGPKQIEIKDLMRGTIQPDYLLFLKKRPDGRYEPVSGRIDPELSVRELLWPLPK